MGRRALYSTEVERKEARKTRTRKRAQTKEGKKLRSAQNRRAYERRRAPSKLRLRFQYVPSFIRHLAIEPIKITTQSLFDTHFYNRDPITKDDGFAQWDTPPPYSVSEALLECGLEDTIDALNGHRMRMQQDREQDLMVRYDDETRDEMWREVHLCIFRLIRESKRLKRQLEEIRSVDEHSVQYVMGLHLLRWKAHAIHGYCGYWKLFRDRTSSEDVAYYFVDAWFPSESS